MPRLGEYDHQALAELLRRQHDVIARAQAFERGLGKEQVRYLLRDGGPWQRLLPSVYLTHTGPPSADQRDLGALLYAGPCAVLTGPSSMRRFGLDVTRADAIDVLVPAEEQRRDVGFARLHRTMRLPRGFCVAGEVRYALPPRAVADAARWLTDIGDVRAVVAEAVQRRMCSIEDLVEELDHGPKQGSALLRRALAEVADGVRSAAEGQLHALIGRSGLPMPMFNPRLFVGGPSWQCPTAGGRTWEWLPRWILVRGTSRREAGRTLSPGRRAWPRSALSCCISRRTSSTGNAARW